MNKKLFKIALSGLALASGSLFAAETVSTSSFNPYVAIKGGFMKPSKRNDVKYKNGGSGAVEFGVSYDAWRLGLEVSYRQSSAKNDIDLTPVRGVDITMKNLKFNALASMINVYYDYALTEEVSLYLGAGLGGAKVAYKGNSVNRAAPAGEIKSEVSKTVFAWQVMAGVSYDINANWTVEAGYKLFNTSKLKDLIGNYKLKTPFCHSIEVGLRYNF